jgi:hypothetical protein
MKHLRSAPERLVREHHILSETIRFRMALEADPHGLWDDARYAEFSDASTEPHYDLPIPELIELRSILERLLTHENMRPVWERFANIDPAVLAPMSRTDLPLVFWEWWIASSIQAVRTSPNITKRQFRDRLKQIQRRIKSLEKAIAGNPIAADWADLVVRLRMAEQRDAMAPITDEKERLFRRTMFLAQLPDVDDARALARESEAAAGWRDTPLPSRLAHWTVQLNDLSLLDLLDCLHRQLGAVGKAGPAIAHRRKSDGGLRPLLTREVREFMQSHFGQPLDDMVGAIVGTVLNDSRGLGRDDVRAYVRRGTGKKR